MSNKVIIGILIFLVIISGGLGYYLYGLDQQVVSLNMQLAALRVEQANQIQAVNNDLTNLREETTSSIDSLKGEIGQTQTSIASLGSELSKAADRVGALEATLDDGLSRIDSLQNQADATSANIGLLENKLSPVMDASEVYKRASQATVRISNGQTTIGSGFIFDESHVITANHVIENLATKYVVLPDGTVFTAALAGTSVQSDVAVLSLTGRTTTEALTLADSDQVKIGAPVAAIGNPFDLKQTLTAGVVSQLNRFTEIQNGLTSRWIANLIQFDAPANPGNSGCPLLNSTGEVIGMVIARIDPSAGDGIYYAVSANKIKRVASAIIAKGSFAYPWLGINLTDITPQMVQDKSLQTENGALVVSVSGGSPAQAAGIKNNDIITAIDGTAISDVADLTSYLGEYISPGDTAQLEVMRGTSTLELSVAIGTAP